MSQLSLPIQEFYLALPDDDRQYAQEQAQEIKLIAHNASIQIGLKLIKVKERLGHGKFGEWIKLEFEWSHMQAHRLMTIASELGNLTYGLDLPQGMKPAYALASAMSKEDEEGKEEILNAYQEKLTEKQNQAIEEGEKAIEEAKLTGKDPKIPKVPTALTEQQIMDLTKELAEKKKELEDSKQKVKELSDAVQQKDEKLAGQEQTLESLNQQLKNKLEQIKEFEQKRIDDANALAEIIINKKQEEFNAQLTQLKNSKESLENKLKTEQENLKKFKENPDPDTVAKIKSIGNELKHLEYELTRLKDTEDQTKKAGIVINNFYDGFLKLLKDHPEALVYAASSYLTDAHTVKATALADHMEEFSHQLRQSLDKSKGNHFLNEIEVDSSVVDVEIVQDNEDMEDF